MSLDKIVFSAPAIKAKTVHEGEEVPLVDGYGKPIKNVNPLLVSIGALDRLVIVDSEDPETPVDPEEPEEPTAKVTNVTFTPASGTVELSEGENLVYTATVEGENFHALELDILIENPGEGLKTKEQFTVYASEEDPIGGDASFEAYGVNVQYVSTPEGGEWTIDFGETVTEALIASDSVKIYAAVLDDNKDNLWGDMMNPSPEMITEVVLERI